MKSTCGKALKSKCANLSGFRVKLSSSTAVLFHEEALRSLEKQAGAAIGRGHAFFPFESNDGEKTLGWGAVVKSARVKERVPAYIAHLVLTDPQAIRDFWTGNLSRCRPLNWNPYCPRIPRTNSGVCAEAYLEHDASIALVRSSTDCSRMGDDKAEAISLALNGMDGSAYALSMTFEPSMREAVYYSACRYGERLVQMADAFPLLFARLLHPRGDSCCGKGRAKDDAVDVGGEAAMKALLDGEKLKKVAALAGVPMSLRWVCRKWTYLGMKLVSAAGFAGVPVDAMRIQRINKAKDFKSFAGVVHSFVSLRSEYSNNWHGRIPPETMLSFARWGVRACLESPEVVFGRGGLGVFHPVWSMSDWAFSSGPNLFGVRPWHDGMSMREAIAASDLWHERSYVAGSLFRTTGRADILPDTVLSEFGSDMPVNGFDIVVLRTYSDLVCEGQSMRHCVATYAQNVLNGSSCICSVRKDGKRLATAQVFVNSGDVVQVRGFANGPVPADVEKAVKEWAKACFCK